MDSTDETLLKESKTTEKLGFLHKDLIAAKVCYFTQFYCMGNITLYVNLFLLSIGLTVTQAGIINGVRPLPAALFSLLVGVFIDKTQMKKVVTLLILIVNVCFVIPTPLVFSLLMKDKSISHLNMTLQSNITAENTSELVDPPPFWFVLLWFVVIGSTGFPLITLIDSSIVCLVKEYEGKVSYGMQRIFAPIGYSIGSIMTGFVIDFYSPGHGLTKYAIIFFIVSVPVTIQFFATIALRMDCKIKDEKTTKEISFVKSLRQVSKNIEFTFLLLTLFVAGISFAVINSYSIILLERIENNKSILGLSMSLSTISEVIIFPFSNRLLIKFPKPFMWFLISIFCYGVRLLVLYFTTEIWHFMISQLLHAFCHSMLWVAVNEYLYTVCTQRVKETLFTLVNITFYMIASFVANVFGGLLFDRFGGRKLFLGTAVVCLITSLPILSMLLRKPKKDRIKTDYKEYEVENIILKARSRTFSQISLTL